MFANLPIIGTNSQTMNLSLAHPYSVTRRLTERVLVLPGMRDRHLALEKGLAAKPRQGSAWGKQIASPILPQTQEDKKSKLTAAELVATAGTLFDQFDTAKAGALDEDAFGQLLNTLFPPLPGGPKKP